MCASVCLCILGTHVCCRCVCVEVVCLFSHRVYALSSHPTGSSSRINPAGWGGGCSAYTFFSHLSAQKMTEDSL